MRLFIFKQNSNASAFVAIVDDIETERESSRKNLHAIPTNGDGFSASVYAFTHRMYSSHNRWPIMACTNTINHQHIARFAGWLEAIGIFALFFSRLLACKRAQAFPLFRLSLEHFWLAF